MKRYRKNGTAFFIIGSEKPGDRFYLSPGFLCQKAFDDFFFRDRKSVV